MSEFITNVEQTTITKSTRGWVGRTYMKINGFAYEICTMKRYNGNIVSHAQKLTSNDKGANFTMVSFSPTQDKNITLFNEKANASEAKIREIHFKALAKIDEMKDEFPTVKPYKLQVGSIFFLHGYGHEKEKKVIYNIDGNKAHFVNAATLVMGFTTLSLIRNYENKFGIGNYYIEYEVMDIDQMANLVIEARAKAQKIEEERPAKEAAVKAELDRKIAGIIAQYPYLIVPNSEHCGGVKVAVNIRIELKRAFPNVKFSVTSDYSKVNIKWDDGPVTDSVKAITDKWQDHHADKGCGDYWDYEPSIFNRAFGGAKFVMENRHTSPETQKQLYAWADERYAEGKTYDTHCKENLAWRLFCQYEIPTGKWEITEHYNSDLAYSPASYWQIVPVQPVGIVQPFQSTTPSPEKSGAVVTRNLAKGGIEIRFSEKPADSILTALNTYGFRWSRFAKVWWIKYSESAWQYANTLII